MQELICSCADVIPQSATDDDRGYDDINTLEDFNDNNDRSANNSKMYRNNNNCNETQIDDKNNEEQRPQFQRKILPNPAAVLKTVAALIAMDCNPQHQNIKNLQQQHEFQMKLHEYQNHQQVPQHFEEDKKHHFHINKKPDLNIQRRCMLLENKESLLEEVENGDENKKVKESIKDEEQNKLTATCTKEQMMKEFENSNYDKYDHYDNNLNSGGGGKEDYYDNGQTNNCFGKNFHNNDSSCNDESKQSQQKYVGSSTTTLSVGNLYRHCKLKTFQKIKLNLITHHGNSSGSSHCSSSSSSSSSLLSSSSMDATTLQTIVETDNDVITANSSTSLSSGLYRIVDEKYKIKDTELSLKVINSQSSDIQSSTPSVANTTNVKYKLYDLSLSKEKSCEKSPSTLSSTITALATDATATAGTTSNTVSKRIEFFEHANIPNGGIIKPKSNIYSIYRVNDNMVIEDEKLVKNVVKLKEAGPSKPTTAASFLLKHDSHTLTIILSCVFIVTFLLLVFFPLPG